MSLTWQFKVPRKIIFGNNSIDNTGITIKDLFDGKALIVTDKIMIEIGIFDSLKKSLEKKGLTYEIFDKVSSEPLDSYVDEGLKIFKEKGCRYLIALGGGSPIDTAKAISAMSINSGRISDYKGLGIIKKKALH